MTKSDDTDRFPPPWSVEESQACFIVKGSRRPVARVCLFRRGARTPRGGQAAHPGRGPAHCRQHRQASRTAAWAPPIKRGVTSPLKTQVRKYRRNALSDVMGQKQTFFPKALQASCSNFLFVQGGTVRTRTSRTRNNHPVWVSTSRHSPCSRKSIGKHQKAYVLSLGVRTSGR